MLMTLPLHPPSCSHSASTHRLAMFSSAFIARHASFASHVTSTMLPPIISAMLTATAISSTCVHAIELAVHGTIRTHHRGIWMACVVVMRLSARVSIVFLMHFDGRHGTRAVP